MPVLQSVYAGLHAAPAPRLATIRGLAARHGIRDGALRTALSRACSAGSLAVSGGRYELGPQSLEEAAAARSLLSRRPGYVLGIVSEGEDNSLPRLRDLFMRLGFRPLQRSIWIGARTADDRLGIALRREGLAGGVTVFQAEEVDHDTRARLSKVWGLSERVAELKKFHRHLEGYLTTKRLNAVEAAWRCVEAAPVWYRVAIRDEPPFPLDFCGADYPLAPLNVFWRSHLQSMKRELAALWEEE